MRVSDILDRTIKYGFYLLFFLVPLIFVANTSELFEFNKMMLTYALTVVIVGAWVIKMIAARKFLYKKTFLEIPLLLYLASHVLSTIFSIDPHVSIWGYYSRFHEGLFASTSYILLYFAAVSNLNKENVYNIIKSSFASAIIISVWGALEHFGHSPSCLMVTGKFDDACWIQDVKSRVFATLGQPNWMAAYLDVLILTAIGLVFKIKSLKSKVSEYANNINWPTVCLIALFLAALYFTKSRSGYAGLAAGLGVLTILLIKIPYKLKIVICAIALAAGTIYGIRWYNSLEPTPSGTITDSEAIRKPVWEGAVKVWERYPVFGSGVETFGYSFYLDRPASKNMDSEWDFLYNKAHNEYLNLLATTGTVGFLAYALLLGSFGFYAVRLAFLQKFQEKTDKVLFMALFSGWVTMLVTNFFGFSVVIIGILFFTIPAFCEILDSKTEPESLPNKTLGTGFILATCLIVFVGLLIELRLYSMWQADIQYNLGKNYDQASEPLNAYPNLLAAVSLSPNEPTFRSELSDNEAVLAGAVYEELKNSTTSALVKMPDSEKMTIKIPQLGVSVSDLSQQAIENSDRVVTQSPNALPFWKNRIKVFYSLSVIDPKYFSQVVAAGAKAVALAPTDAKVHYTYGLILEQAGEKDKAKQVMEETVKLKPDYTDAIQWLQNQK